LSFPLSAFRIPHFHPQMDKLTEIMAWKRREIAPRIRAVPEAELARMHAARPKPASFAGALRREDGRLAVIAEIKRRSPSAGDIRPGASAAEQARRYRAAGADALSVLTDEKYFGGCLDDLRAAGAEAGPSLPRLRKDFMVHPIQVLEARDAGASAILLIVRALSDEEMRILHGAAQAAGLDALFEIHDEADLERAVRHDARLIGVNNRDLAVFRTDLALSERLIPLLPPGMTAVGESGIFNGADAARLRAAGAHAVLVGEALMKSEDPGALIRELRGER
jgi:indole-3-glycerol phosphate synthase